jgi:hypothetical protein
MATKPQQNLSAVLARYPIAHELEGWCFRLETLSYDHWLAQGVTLSAQQVACEGAVPTCCWPASPRPRPCLWIIEGRGGW